MMTAAERERTLKYVLKIRVRSYKFAENNAGKKHFKDAYLLFSNRPYTFPSFAAFPLI